MKVDLPKIFTGETVTIVGGGPSLKGFDYSRLQDPVIGTNHSMKFHKGDLLVVLDQLFIRKEKEYLDSLDCLKVTYNFTGREDFIMAGLSPNHKQKDEDWHILRANLAGFFALGLSLHLGAETVILLGYDGGYKDRRNFHDLSYNMNGKDQYEPVNQYYDIYKGRNIINVGLGSRIESFRKVSIEEDFYELSKLLESV